jgi:surface-anchored protein
MHNHFNIKNHNQPTHYTIMKNNLKHLLTIGLLAATLLSTQSLKAALITISSGHTDIFELEYESIGGSNSTHLGVHTDAGHYEPGDVILEVGNAAYTNTTAFNSTIVSLLGSNAWILPADLEVADALGVIQAGVAKSGFNGAASFSMLRAGPDNPGNFALFTSGSSIRLSSTGDSVGTNSFSISTGTGHIHYNWGFSAPGIYTFDMKASYGGLQSAVETYTFNVVPEPSTYALLGAGSGILLMVRYRSLRRRA